jgi:aminoglycoside phosphotransferase (APT) family kinase protein
VPLAQRDAVTRAWIRTLGDAIDAEAVTAAWEDALRVPEWRGRGVWIHGDLDGRNLLVLDGRLSGVIDWGGLGVGDPAYDVMVAWKLLPAEARTTFRGALDVDDAAWARAKGGTLSQSLGALAYYSPETNPTLFEDARRWLTAVTSEA